MGKRRKDQIAEFAKTYRLQMIYAFGSRAKEVLDLMEGRINILSSTPSDLDIGIKPEKPLTVEEKVEIAIFFEDLLNHFRSDGPF